MQVSVSIYGTAKSVSPDIMANFTLSEHMQNGKWSYGIRDFSYDMRNELIDEIDESRMVDRIKEKICTLINSPVGPMWVKSPVLRIYYNPDDLGNVTVKSSFG
jgi:hypothetical protein